MWGNLVGQQHPACECSRDPAALTPLRIHTQLDLPGQHRVMAGAFTAPDRKSIVSHAHARHRKSPRSAPAHQGAAAQNRRSSSRARRKPAKVALAAVVGSALLVSGWQGAVHLMALAHHPAALSQADMLGLPTAGATQNPLAGHGPATPSAHASQRPLAPRVHVTQQPKIVSMAVSRPGRPYYVNPLRSVSGLVPERIDEGVDFGGTGPVYPLGDATVTNAGENSGWPGGGWITYQLTDGPDQGLMVYLAEDVTPTVQGGQHVTPSTVIANMFNGGDGIETGWAQPTGVSAESELPEAGGIGGGGPFPTMVGLNFDQLLQVLGVPAAPNAGQTAYGLLPANYPTVWK
jgi:murein DD-endopeptidase MepM/ murein hydrolase activator NlpD